MSERKLKESEEQIDTNLTLIGKEFFISLLNEINSYVDDVVAKNLLEQTKDELMDALLKAITQTQAKEFNAITKKIFSDYYKKAMIPGEEQLVKNLIEDQIIFSRKIVDLITNTEKQLNSVTIQIKDVDTRISEIDKLNSETKTQTRDSLKGLLGSFAQIALATGKEVTRRVIKKAIPEHQLQNKNNTNEINGSEEQSEQERNELQVRRSKQESVRVTLDEQYFIFQTYNNLLYAIFSSAPDYMASKITISLIEHILKYLKLNVARSFSTSVDTLKLNYDALLNFKLQYSETSKPKRTKKNSLKVKRVPDILHLNVSNSPKRETKKNFVATDNDLAILSSALNFDELEPLAFKPVSPMQTIKIAKNIRLHSPLDHNSVSSFNDVELKPEEPAVLQPKVKEGGGIQKADIDAEVIQIDESLKIFSIENSDNIESRTSDDDKPYESFTEENNTNTQPIKNEAQVELALLDTGNNINGNNYLNASVEANPVNTDKISDVDLSDLDVSAIRLSDKPVATIVKHEEYLKFDKIKEKELYLENSEFINMFFNAGEINYQTLLTLTKLQEKLITSETLKQKEVNTYAELNTYELQKDIFQIEQINMQLNNVINNLAYVNKILDDQKRRFINYKWEKYKASLPFTLSLTESKFKDAYLKLIEDKAKLELLSAEESEKDASYRSTKCEEVSEKIQIDEKVELYIQNRITELQTEKTKNKTKDEQLENKEAALEELKNDLVKIQKYYYSLSKLPAERSVYQNALSTNFDEVIKDRLTSQPILAVHRNKFSLFLREVANILLGIVSLGSVPLTRFFLKRPLFIGVETKTEKNLQEFVEHTNQTLKCTKR